MLLLDLYVDLQIEIMCRLSGPDLLRMRQVNRYFRELCSNSNQLPHKLPNKLDNRFKESTREMFGIPNKLTDSWYATFLILYNDLMKTSNRVIKIIPIKAKDIDLREDVSSTIVDLFRDVINKNSYYRDDRDYSYYFDDDAEYDDDDQYDDKGVFSILKFTHQYADKFHWFTTKLHLMKIMKYMETDSLDYPQYHHSKPRGDTTDTIIHQFINKYLPTREEFLSDDMRKN